jgi:hypothetical protein
MNRVNFANCSQVIVDVCRGHGTWFDKDELRRIVGFIRGGGLEAARAREMAELERRQREVKAANIASAWSTQTGDRPLRRDEWMGGLEAAAALLRKLVR